jgi:O-antigen/teichoic acid export membrane protein
LALYTRKRTRRSLFDTAIYRAISQAATLLGYVVMVRGMSEHDFGVFNLIYSFLPVVSTAASFGLEQTLRRFQPEYLRAENPSAAARLVRFVAAARFGSNVIILAVILLAWNTFAPFLHLEPYKREFAIFGILVLLHFQARVLQLSFASHMLHRYSVGFLATLSIVKLVGYLILVSVHRLDLQTAILADMAAYAIGYARLSILHRRHCRPPAASAKFRFDAAERRRLFRYGIYYNFNDAGALPLNVRSDNFFIAAIMNPVAVGTYSFYTRLNIMTARALPTNVFENVIQPIFFAIPAGEAATRIARYFTLLVDLNLVVHLPILAYVTVYHHEIVQVLFAGKFITSSLLMPLVFAFATLNVIGNPVTFAAQYAEKAPVILLSKIFALYNIATLVLFIPKWGVYGAALSTGSAEFMKNLFIWWHVRGAARWGNAVNLLKSAILVWGGFIAAGLAIKEFVPVGPFLQLLAGGLLVVTAALLFLRSPALSAADRGVLASVLHGKETRALQWLGLLPRTRSTKA